MICYIINIWFGADFEYDSNLAVYQTLQEVQIE
jgi:hypothetical protein